MTEHADPRASPVAAPDEARALTRLGFDELRRGAGGVQGVHRAVAGRVFGALGPLGWPTRVVHDTIADGVYAAVRGVGGLMGTGADVALARRRRVGEARSVSTTRGGATAIGIVTGLAGDRLEAEGNELIEPMAVRVGGQVIEPRADVLAAAFPAATPRLAVFVHGLMESEHAWLDEDGETYGSRLERELGATPVFVRFNSGRHISENGRALAELLDAVVGAWPEPVERIDLIGHSMGGLIARSAAHYATEDGLSWTSRVRTVVSLGSPHVGAPLEQVVHWASAGLHLAPESRPFASFLRRRSHGIRDLRHGSLVDEDWQGRDPDALRSAAIRELPLLEGATHHFVAATITRSPRHPVGRLIGDWLVLVPSAAGRGRSRRIPFRPEDGVHVGGVTHIALLRHPGVYEALRGWLAPTPELEARTPALPASS